MRLQVCFNHSEDRFPLPADIRKTYGAFGFPDAPDDRPHVSSNFVMSLDGRAAFRELPGENSGSEVSRSATDRWLMDFLRAHHDAQLIGAGTVRAEGGPDGLGWDYSIEDEQLLAYRRNTLRLGRQKIMVLSASGDLDLRVRGFNSPVVEPWIITTDGGAANLEARMSPEQRERITIVPQKEGGGIDMHRLLQRLRKEYGIATLLCEGGPSVYGELLALKLIDEDFRTLSTQVLGESTQPLALRPTAYGNVSYTPQTAPWFELVSLHTDLPFHVFLRLRYVGPQAFPAGAR